MGEQMMQSSRHLLWRKTLKSLRLLQSPLCPQELTRSREPLVNRCLTLRPMPSLNDDTLSSFKAGLSQNRAGRLC
ncbi:MAG: hypothetical protein ETSY2_32675 [Candidatus Entotheonella gemina]|uniref:Uncharacterized protein n=1 Tax=Candidatus Entotheonella gemina TaxID=1429439 RepID=W4M266_9BACT|nr:MAG: hypothetical protein ETSY2_32675 [Candidatus Entotheonella gemina]